MKSYKQETRRFSDAAGFPVHMYIKDGGDIPMHRHHELELLTARRGEVRVHFSTESVLLSAGQVLFVNSGVLHSVDCSDGACAYIMLSDELIAPTGSEISLKYVKPLLMNSELAYIHMDSSALWHRELYSLTERLGSLLISNGGVVGEAGGLGYPEAVTSCYELDVHCCITQLWRLLYTDSGASSHSRFSGNEYVARRRTQLMTDFIRQNYRSQISLEEIAASASISKSEASRCFQSCLHVSPVSYLLRYRTEMAAHLLLNSSMTIEEISFDCGFGSASYFCRMFRQYAGVTPGEYRKGVR